MDDFPGNSRETRSPAKTASAKTEAKKEVRRVVTGEVTQRKTPLGKKVKEFFFGGNSRGVWGYVAMEVLIPATKDMVADAGREAIERLVFGEARSRRGLYRPGGGYATPYNKYATTRPSSTSPPWRPEPPVREMSRRSRMMHNFNEILLDTRGEAEDVIDQLNEIIREYGQATVSDLYALVGIKSDYTDKNYGWTTLQGANASHVRGGQYLLNLPKPEALD